MDLQEILNKWGIKCDINTVLAMWNESHRYYHNLNHLNDLIDQINEGKNKLHFSERIYEKLLITALFHDIVYDPMKSDNEEKSAEFFMECATDKYNEDIPEIKQMILDTKDHKVRTHLSDVFNRYDMDIVNRNYDQLLDWEQGIYEEYKGYGNGPYKEGRLKFLEGLLDSHINNTENLLKLVEYVKSNY